MIRSLIKYILLCLVFGTAGWWLRSYTEKVTGDEDPIAEVITNLEKPLEKYSIDNLKRGVTMPGLIKIKSIINEEEKYTSYLFEFVFSPDLSGKTKSTTGQINIPNDLEGSSPYKNYPVVLMFRGYVDEQQYSTGDGTRSAAKFLAENGFVTIAPDFLGYGESDKESGNIFETRFQTYTTALSLLKTLESISDSPNFLIGLDSSKVKQLNNQELFIWAHSNGGQIALTVLTATGAIYPTALWAPVTKPFPYSVLYYTDSSADGGKLIRRELAEFEGLYNVDKFAYTNYLESINSPILLQQGANDNAVPVLWSSEFNAKLKSVDKDIKYIIYPETDHNMRPSWDMAIEADLEFYRSYIETKEEN